MGYVFHGSKVRGLKVIEPHQSTHGNYVYATKNKAIAIIMSKRCGGDYVYDLYYNDETGKYDLIERVPGAFKKMFSNDASIYTLDDSSFKNIDSDIEEVVSEVSVPVVSEERCELLSDAIKKLEEEGYITIYTYPSRPSYIPQDDTDLIRKIRHTYIEKLNYQFSSYQISRWIFLHPNLEDDFRNIAKELNLNIPSYEDIVKMFKEKQLSDPEHECFIDNALEMYNQFKK